MADLTIKLPTDLQNQIDRISNGKEIAPKMLRAAQKVVEPEIKRRLQKHIRTGALIDSVNMTDPKMDKNGEWKAYITFPGKDENGTANGQKAMALEYGTSKQVADPFLRPAKAAKQAEAEKAMQDIFSAEVKK